MSKWSVRRAVEKDIPWIAEQVEQFLLFMGGDIPFNAPHIEQLVLTFIKQHFMLVVEKDGELSGVWAGMLHPHFLNPDVKVLTEVMWWVPEEKRNSRAGLLLLSAQEQIARHYGVQLECLSTEVGSPLNQGSLEKRGFKLQEHSWIRKW